MRIAYKHVLKPALFRCDPEWCHNRFVEMGELFGQTKAGQGMIDRLYGYHGPDIRRVVDSIEYPTPIVLAAGFDYNGRLTQILRSVGFGGVEVGSVTARPCAGNEPPRLRRAIRSQSLIVYKGLKNQGVDRIIERLTQRERQPGLVVGISIAMTNDNQCADLYGAIEDYATSFEKLNAAGVGDYYTINISCPNVHSGENFASVHRLPLLLQRLSQISCSKPRYAKLPINIDSDQLRALLDVLRRFDFSGAVIGNLNKDYSSLKFPEEAPATYRGGLSGKPCFARSNELIRVARKHCGRDFTIIGCGGVLSACDALEKLDAGANLIQLITGMIFEGPHLMKDIAWAIARRAQPVPAAAPTTQPAIADAH